MKLFILILGLVFALIYFNQNKWIEIFFPINAFKYPLYPLTNSSSNWFYKFFPISNNYTNLPWNNTSLGNTTNMSYDLRGDPLIIPRTEFIWNNSSTFPIYNLSI